ncbi:hypothetical protein Tco_1506985 [Tanacetum coccineum]
MYFTMKLQHTNKRVESFQSNKPCKNQDSPEFRKFFEINELKAQLQAKNSTINNLKKQIKNVHEKSNEAKFKHDIDVIETINIKLEHIVAKLLKENKTLKKHYKDLYDSINVTRTKTIEQTTSLIAKNDEFKAQLQEKRFTIAALKNELRKLTGNSVNTKFAKPSILGKPVLQPLRNQSVVRQPTVFRSERPKFSKPRFASQVDVNNVLSKPITSQSRPNEKESAFAKHHHMIASSSSRISSKRVSFETPKEHVRPTVMFKQIRSIITTIPVADHSKNPRSFSESKHFVCSTCHKCVFNANHDNCITKFLKEVNSRAKVQSPKTRNNNKPVEPKSHTQKPGRQIAIGQRFSLNKSSAVHEKPNTPRSCLRWIPTGRIFKLASLRWIPTGKMFIDNTTKVDSEPPNGSNEDITNPYECDQILNVSAGTLNLSAGTSFNPNKRKDQVWSLEEDYIHKPRVQGIQIDDHEHNGV